MDEEIALKVLEVLESIDQRITDVEKALENIRVDDFDFTAWGSDKQTIKEIRNLITKQKNKNEKME